MFFFFFFYHVQTYLQLRLIRPMTPIRASPFLSRKRDRLKWAILSPAKSSIKPYTASGYVICIITITIIHVYPYNIHVRIYVLLLKPSLRPPFVNLSEKAPISRDLSFNFSLSPSLPSYIPCKILQIADIRSSQSEVQTSQLLAREYTLSVLVYMANGAMPSIVRISLTFFFFKDRRKANESHRAGQ